MGRSLVQFYIISILMLFGFALLGAGYVGQSTREVPHVPCDRTSSLEPQFVPWLLQRRNGRSAYGRVIILRQCTKQGAAARKTR